MSQPCSATEMSLASAANLTLTGPAAGTLQAGTTTILNVDCQTTPITVKYAAPLVVSGVYKSASIDVAGITASCASKNYKLVALTTGKTAVAGLAEQSGVLAATPGTLTLDISSLAQTVVDTIGVVSLTIYS